MSLYLLDWVWVCWWLVTPCADHIEHLTAELIIYFPDLQFSAISWVCHPLFKGGMPAWSTFPRNCSIWIYAVSVLLRINKMIYQSDQGGVGLSFRHRIRYALTENSHHNSSGSTGTEERCPYMVSWFFTKQAIQTKQ